MFDGPEKVESCENKMDFLKLKSRKEKKIGIIYWQ